MNKLLFLSLLIIDLYAQTIKDVSNIVGIRENQLLGYGLVVGLPGTGDKSQFTMQSLQNLLRNSYVKIPTSSIKSKNIATVMVTAILPPFSRQGDKIKINVSSIGDAKSIDGGELLLTQLKGVDGKVYGLAQGNILANQTSKTTGFIYDGATIENELEFSLKGEKSITLSLFKNDAKTAASIEKKINKEFNSFIAQAIDTRTIEIQKPNNISIVSFIAKIQEIELETDILKKIIIDIAREVIVSGSNIKIKPITITQKNFTIKIKKSSLNNDDFNDPAKNLGEVIGDGVVIGIKPVNINLNNALVNTNHEPTISDLMRSMKIMKLDIKEIIKTLQMLKELNAIDAKLEIIR
ncbi:MAG TPA: flagellar basal body P-ring protein FlgI [Arcobacter sp.]|nr:flagellar basal body P-ring protein FlgI [Arcobacter sp.]HIP56393.1 flagellar basal body P-ring protein FlgI [Arcobacter sp.]